jgi:ribosome-associated toxin RatA of RatAB toxin-antitoxin module
MAIVTLTEERIINATPTQVYQALINVNNYHLWNPWIRQAEGIARVGSNVKVAIDLGRNRLEHYDHNILACESDRYFAWEDKGWFTLFAKGSRHRYLQLTEEGSTHYKVELTIQGVFANVAHKKFGRAMAKGLASEADGLKKFCEFNQRNKR